MIRKNFYISQAQNFIGEEVEIRGWVYNKRSSGSIVFLQLRDGTGFIQATVIKNDISKDTFKQAEQITLETSAIIQGIIKEEKRAPSGYELIVKDIKIISLSDEYPLGKKEHGPDFLLSNRHLWLRSQRQWAIMKIRMKLFELIEEFYRENGFTRVDTPIISPNACEGTTTLFEIDYFGEKAYLSQSGQLYLEAALASFGKVYDFTPVFRAEKSKTRRHLIEFWMTNAEIAFIDWQESMEFQEKMIIHILNRLITDCSFYFQIIDREINTLKKIRSPFERITYHQAIAKLKNLGSDIKWGEDFGNNDETLLMNYYQQPIFVTRYPAAIKAFYMKRDPNEPKLVLCSDLLVPEGYGEIIGGSEREDDYTKLEKSMNQHEMNKTDYYWYLDIRKYGSVPHSGFGLGLERFLAWICKLDHVRETIPFPRMLERFRP